MARNQNPTDKDFRNKVGKDATATTEADPRFIAGNPTANADSENLRAATADEEDDDEEVDDLDLDEEEENDEDADEEDEDLEDEDDEEDAEDEDEEDADEEDEDEDLDDEEADDEEGDEDEEEDEEDEDTAPATEDTTTTRSRLAETAKSVRGRGKTTSPRS